MNFYDKVHELVRCLKYTDEYKEYVKIKSDIKNDDSAYKMIKDFKEKQKEHQINYINTGKIDEVKQKELQNLYSIVIQNENLRKLLECEMKINVMLADMQKIVGDGIKEIVEF